MDTKTLQTLYTPKERGKPLTLDRQLAALRFSPDGKLLAGGDFEGRVVRWDASSATLTALPDLPGHHGWVQALAFAPDGSRLFTADSWGRMAARTIAGSDARPLWAVEAAHPAWVRRLAVSPDGKTLASCSADGLVRLSSAATGARLRDWSLESDPLALAWRPDGGAVAVGDLHGQIHEYDASSGNRLRRLQAAEMYRLDRIQEVGGVRCLSYDPSGKTLAAAGCLPTSGGFVQGTPLLVFFDAASGKLIQSLKIGTTNDGYVLDLHWHPGGFVMGVSSGQPGQGKLFFHRPGDAAPFFLTPKMVNCHALAVHDRRLVVAATNANSSGNGRPKTKDMSYPGNSSPLYAWELPETNG